MTNSGKDYIRSLGDSKELASKIQSWWHKRGFPDVKVWVETHKSVSSFGSRLPPNHYIRSNISMSVDNVENGMVE